MNDPKIEALNNALAVGAMSKYGYLQARAQLAEEEAISIIRTSPQAQERNRNEGFNDRFSNRPRPRARYHE
jgi:hypothetical protein